MLIYHVGKEHKHRLKPEDVCLKREKGKKVIYICLICWTALHYLENIGGYRDTSSG